MFAPTLRRIRKLHVQTLSELSTDIFKEFTATTESTNVDEHPYPSFFVGIKFWSTLNVAGVCDHTDEAGMVRSMCWTSRSIVSLTSDVGLCHKTRSAHEAISVRIMNHSVSESALIFASAKSFV